MTAYAIFDGATLAQRVCNLVQPHLLNVAGDGVTGTCSIDYEAKDAFDTPLGWPVVKMSWTPHVSGQFDEDWLYVFIGERGNPELLDADRLKAERPWYHYIGYNQPHESISLAWETTLVDFVRFVLQEIYHCTITPSITVRELTEAATIHECRFYLGSIEDNVIVFFAGLGRYVFEANQFGWESGGVPLPDAFSTPFPDFDPTSGIMGRLLNSDAAPGGGGGGDEIDLTPLVDKLTEIKDAIDDISLNASFDNGRSGVTLRGASGGD